MESQHAARASVGIGLRTPHASEIRATRPALGWLEIHSENYLGDTPLLADVLALRRDYELSLHGVGLSLGSAEGIDPAHLAALHDLIDRTAPFAVSEHLAWNIVDGVYLNDLLPLPYTEESLDIVARNVAAAQDALGRRLLVENPSRYLRFRHSPIPEAEFLAALVRRTGCGILCDVNNVFVSCANLGGDARAYLDALPAGAIGEIHLAGHARIVRNGREMLIDDHGAPVCDAVWALYRDALDRFGPVATLIEWDKNLPDLSVLTAEARRAEIVGQAEAVDVVAA